MYFYLLGLICVGAVAAKDSESSDSEGGLIKLKVYGCSLDPHFHALDTPPRNGYFCDFDDQVEQLTFIAKHDDDDWTTPEAKTTDGPCIPSDKKYSYTCTDVRGPEDTITISITKGKTILKYDIIIRMPEDSPDKDTGDYDDAGSDDGDGDSDDKSKECPAPPPSPPGVDDSLKLNRLKIELIDGGHVDAFQPPFSQDIFNYEIWLPEKTMEIQITAFPNDQTSKVMIPGFEPGEYSTEQSIYLFDDNYLEEMAFAVIVTNEDEKFQPYSIYVHRSPCLNDCTESSDTPDQGQDQGKFVDDQNLLPDQIHGQDDSDGSDNSNDPDDVDNSDDLDDSDDLDNSDDSDKSDRQVNVDEYDQRGLGNHDTPKLANWHVGEWQDCESSLEQHRTVNCMVGDNAVSDEDCGVSDKPTVVQDCVDTSQGSPARRTPDDDDNPYDTLDNDDDDNDDDDDDDSNIMGIGADQGMSIPGGQARSPPGIGNRFGAGPSPPDQPDQPDQPDFGSIGPGGMPADNEYGGNNDYAKQMGNDFGGVVPGGDPDRNRYDPDSNTDDDATDDRNDSDRDDRHRDPRGDADGGIPPNMGNEHVQPPVDNVDDTFKWAPGPWGDCVDGHQTRQVQCQFEDMPCTTADCYCIEDDKPTSQRECQSENKDLSHVNQVAVTYEEPNETNYSYIVLGVLAMLTSIGTCVFLRCYTNCDIHTRLFQSVAFFKRFGQEQQALDLPLSGNGNSDPNDTEAGEFIRKVLKRLGFPELSIKPFTQKLAEDWITSVEQLTNLDDSEWRRLAYPDTIEKELRKELKRPREDSEDRRGLSLRPKTSPPSKSSAKKKSPAGSKSKVKDTKEETVGFGADDTGDGWGLDLENGADDSSSEDFEDFD